MHEMKAYRFLPIIAGALPIIPEYSPILSLPIISKIMLANRRMPIWIWLSQKWGMSISVLVHLVIELMIQFIVRLNLILRVSYDAISGR